MTTQPISVSVPEAGEFLGIGTTLTWEQVRSGALPSFRIGRRRLILFSDLQVFAERRAHGDVSEDESRTLS